MIVEEDILKKIEESEKIEDSFQLIRLYENYKKYNDIYLKDNIKKINIIDIKIAYENIKVNVEDILKINNKSKIDKLICNNFEKLQVYINHFKIDNNEIFNNTLEIITNLEILLDLPISFPNYIVKCLEKLLNKNNDNKKLNK